MMDEVMQGGDESNEIRMKGKKRVFSYNYLKSHQKPTKCWKIGKVFISKSKISQQFTVSAFIYIYRKNSN